jgi:hypothetical protein
VDTEYLIATAARAPSVHNTQPWLFRVGEREIELYCDPRRQLRSDPDGREMVISCGGALFGLRLGFRSQGYRPVVTLFPDGKRACLLARVAIGDPAPMDLAERELLWAIPHRHTHRGAFEPGAFPPELAAGLRQDALAEGAALAFADEEGLQRLTAIVEAADFKLSLDPEARNEIREWTRPESSQARDGVPATAFRAAPARSRGRLPQRDFDLGRGVGRLPSDVGGAPSVTAALLTPGDTTADWLVAGQALYRVLLRAASRWVSASLFTQPLETEFRALLRARVPVAGTPQMLIQLGRVRTVRATARRPPDELIVP